MIRKYQYKEWLIARGLQPRTIEQYTLHADNFSSLYDRFNQDNVDDFISKYKGNVVKSFVKSFQSYLLRNPANLNPPISPKSVNKIRAIVVESTVARKRKTPKVITEEDVRAIYNKMPNKKTKLMLMLSFYCGLRVNELLNLKAGAFNLNDWERKEMKGMGLLTFIRKRNKEGFVPGIEEVMKEAWDYLEDEFKEDDLLFADVHPRTWHRILGRASIAAIGRHVNPHLLRHSIAMHLRGKGFAIDEIKEFLGHEDISTTQIYSRVTPDQLMEKFEDLKSPSLLT